MTKPKNQKVAFTFYFADEDSNSYKIAVIEIKPQAHTEAKEEAFYTYTSTMEEKYNGIHDGCGSGSGSKDKGNYTFGFNTYEIQGQDQDKCVADWQKQLAQIFGQENLKPLIWYISQAQYSKDWD